MIQQPAYSAEEEEEENADKAFFEYLGTAYQVFLAGDDDQYNLLEKEEAAKHGALRVALLRVNCKNADAFAGIAVCEHRGAEPIDHRTDDGAGEAAAGAQATDPESQRNQGNAVHSLSPHLTPALVSYLTSPLVGCLCALRRHCQSFDRGRSIVKAISRSSTAMWRVSTGTRKRCKEKSTGAPRS